MKLLLILNGNMMLLLLFNIHLSNELFKNRYMSNLKEKAKDYFKSKFGKKGLNFLGYDMSEYPGVNKMFRKENKDKWEEYYYCLNIQQANLGYRKSFTPEAVQTVEGNSVRCNAIFTFENTINYRMNISKEFFEAINQFDCKICISPQERDSIESVEWEFGSVNAEYMSPIEFTEHIMVSPEHKDLTMYNLHEENSGQYICRIGQTMTAPIYLTVIKVGQNFTEVHSSQAPKGPYPISPVVIDKYGIIVDTVWTEWSPCSRCGRVGKRHRYGHCIVRYSKVQKRSASEDATVKNNTVEHESRPEISKNEIDLLRIFKNGIPCQSHILPQSFKDLPEVKTRKTEIMVGYCKIHCPKAKLFEVKDQAGRVVEVANNSAGVYSLLQPLPPLEPPVMRTIEYHKKGNEIVISCPGNLNSDVPVEWQIGTKKVIPELLRERSGGRVFVTVLDKIRIQDARVGDSNLYSCWQSEVLAGSIRLVVEKKIQINVNQHIMLFGCVIILSTFLYVFVKAFLGRKYAKTY